MTIIGIDLGTTNSLVGVWKDTEPFLIPNALGDVLTPSVVGLDDRGEILIGKGAKERLITHPNQTVSNFKRWMGSKRITTLGAKSFLPEELSSLVLRSLVRDAEQFLGESVSEAVISVPAYFNDIQRNATKAAGQLAGLKVERIINEPTAAALAYGRNHQEESSTLIFDLGGGTFDVTLLEQFEGVIEVHSTAGDNYLGGEDFRQLLIDHLVTAHNLQDQRLSPQLSKMAEQLKITLTTQHEAPYSFFIDRQEIKGTITRNEFEILAEPLILRIRTPLERAIRDAGIALEKIDNVILAGGATRMPVIRHEIGRLLRKLPLSHLNPDEIVARGVVVQAGLKERNKDLQDIVLTDVCPFTLGIGSLRPDEGYKDQMVMTPIIERNATIPISRNQFFTPTYSLQRKVSIRIFQGESLHLDNNIELGDMQIKVPIGFNKERAIDVRFTYDINAMLEVIVSTAEAGKTEKKIFDTAGLNLSKEEITQRFKELEYLKMAPWEQQKNRALLARSERLYEELTGDVREILLITMGEFKTRLEDQTLQSSDEKRLQDDFSEFLDQLDRPLF